MVSGVWGHRLLSWVGTCGRNGLWDHVRLIYSISRGFFVSFQFFKPLPPIPVDCYWFVAGLKSEQGQTVDKGRGMRPILA